MFDTAPTLRVGYACALRCVSCDVPAESHPADEPDPAALVAALDVHIAAGAPAVVLSGGEPLLHPGLVGVLVRRARAAGVAVAVETSGVPISAAVATQLAASGVSRVYVGVPSLVRPQQDAHAGAAGVGDAVRRGLLALQAAGVPTWLDVLLTAATQRTLVATVRTAADRMGWLEGLRLTGLAPRGRARGGDQLPRYLDLAEALGAAGVVAAEAGMPLQVRAGTLPACLALRVSPRPRPPGGPPTGQFGPPCAGCALRPACPGAPAEAWDLQGGLGLSRVEALVEPWDREGGEVRHQGVVRVAGQPHAELARALVALDTPTRWLWTHTLVPGVGTLPFTHLALELHGNALPVAALGAIRGFGRPVHVGLRLPSEPFPLDALVHALRLSGVGAVAMLATEAWVPTELHLRERHPTLDVRRVPPPG